MTATAVQSVRRQVLTAMEKFISGYMALPIDGWAFMLALWAIGTWTYETFDAFPYLVITAATKQSGKTRLLELLSFLSRNPQNFSAMTPAVLYRTLGDANATGNGATIFADEAEQLSSNAANMMRSILNVGYRKGQTIPRVVNNVVVNFQVYCPKAFALIGDVYDTLRDRSIVVELRRGKPSRLFSFSEAKNEARAITSQLERIGRYTGEAFDATAIFPNGRDAEIWAPLFALCGEWAPERMAELTRLAVDLAAEKTATAKRYVEHEQSEDTASADTFSDRLLRDLQTVYRDGERALTADHAIERLYAIDAAPWRKYRGDGLTAISMADMLSRYGVKAKQTKTHGRNVRAYHAADVASAIGKYLAKGA